MIFLQDYNLGGPNYRAAKYCTRPALRLEWDVRQDLSLELSRAYIHLRSDPSQVSARGDTVFKKLSL